MNSDNIWIKILMVALAVIFAVAGWLISAHGFNAIQSIRQIERLPTTTIATSLPGEVKISARAQVADGYVKSQHYKTDTLYYRYRYEEEERDSDGNTYWDTKYVTTDSVNFKLTDNSGDIYVDVTEDPENEINISLPISTQNTYGDVRHTEWRIMPGDELFVMAKLKTENETAKLSFFEPGQYIPTISKYSEDDEKSSIGTSIVLKVAGGISLISLAVFFLVTGLAIHRLIAFLSILSFAVFIPLVHLGTGMLYDDITAGEKRLNTQTQFALERINNLTNLQLSNLTDAAQRLESDFIDSPGYSLAKEVLENHAFFEMSYKKQLKAFPNNLISFWFTSLDSEVFDSLSADSKNKVNLRLRDYQQTTTKGLMVSVSIGGGILICIGLTYFGFRLVRLKRHIENVPTSKSSGLVFGLSEIQGRITKIEDQEPLESPLTFSSCYWYHYKVQEKRGSGDNEKWVTIEERQDHKPFYCNDATGQTKVMPLHAEIISKHSKTERRGNYRYTEKVLKISDKVYVLGNAKIDRDKGDTLVIRGEKKERPFLITNLTERQIMLRKAQGGMFSLTVAFSALIFASLFYLGMTGSFSPADYLIAALIAPIYMTIMVCVLHYNDLVFLKQRAARNLSNIGVSLQKRLELIPNLEKIVKKYLVHEKSLLKKLTELRTTYVTETDDFEQVENQIKTEQEVLTQMIARAEDYPELKAHQLNIKLMNKLVDLENEVALMREGYNDAVTYYNTRIETIPDVFFAKMFGFSSMEIFQFEGQRFKRVTIDLD